MAARFATWPVLLRRALAEPLSSRGDAELLERFVSAADEPAFAALLERHGPMVLGVCRRLLGDAHRAEDAFQATFLVLARRARSVRRRDSLACWLFGVASRLSRQARRAEAARLRREARAARRPEAGEADTARQELLALLDEELGRLPERHREPLVLCYLGGRTQDEAAGQLGWSISTLKRRLEAGRRLLRSRLTARGATLGAALLPAALATPALAAPLREAALASVFADARGSAVPAAVAALAEGGAP